MKKRFIVTLELESDVWRVQDLRRKDMWCWNGQLDISHSNLKFIQVQVNLIKPSKKAKAKKRG